MAVQPIRPDQIGEIQASLKPDFVMQAWNEMIATSFSKGVAEFTEAALIARIIELAPETEADIIIRFPHPWLEMENVFRAQGWYVSRQPILDIGHLLDDKTPRPLGWFFRPQSDEEPKLSWSEIVASH